MLNHINDMDVHKRNRHTTGLWNNFC